MSFTWYVIPSWLITSEGVAAWGKISLGLEYTTDCIHVTHSGQQILKVEQASCVK